MTSFTSEQTPPFIVRLVLGFAWVGVIATSLTACAGAREVEPPPISRLQTTLNGEDVIVRYYGNIQSVRQADPNLCWAASMEQALRHLGVDTDQNRIAEEVYPGSDAQDRTINLFWWHQKLSITRMQLTNGSQVWARTDIDGWQGGRPILSTTTFVRKIVRELGEFRIPLIGITTGPGRGHVVTVIGFASPVHVKGGVTDPVADVVGFLIYDPAGKPQLYSTEALFNRFVALVYVTTHDTGAGAIGYEAKSTTRVW